MFVDHAGDIRQYEHHAPQKQEVAYERIASHHHIRSHHIKSHVTSHHSIPHSSQQRARACVRCMTDHIYTVVSSSMPRRTLRNASDSTCLFACEVTHILYCVRARDRAVFDEVLVQLPHHEQPGDSISSAIVKYEVLHLFLAGSWKQAVRELVGH